MSIIKELAVFSSLLLVLSSCSDQITNSYQPEPIRELSAIEKKVTAADNNFGLKLFRQIISSATNKNIFISPLSVSMALGMAYNGADGETRTEMHNMLEFGDLTAEEINKSYRSLINLLSSADPDVTFEIANSIWYRTGFSILSEFLQLNTTYFDAVVQALDFNRTDAADIINGWVNEKTHEKIPTIVDSPIDPYTVMFLINAIYFKGTWTYEFGPENTLDVPFYLKDGNQITCAMMNHKATHGYYANDRLQIADLTYGEIGFSMTIILPNAELDVDSVAADLTTENWEQWTNNLTETEINVFLPRFETEYEIGLIPTLQALGMVQAFNSSQANFDKINPDYDLYISNVKHKTYVNVDEEGTEAAAVTSIEIGYTSVGNEITFRVDRPFIFALREKSSDTILFIGKIMNPNG